MLQISVLGPIEVRRDGELVSVPGGKTSELLVRLALEAGSAVRAERLLDELWAGAAATRLNTLQAKVTRLRRALGDPALLAANDHGYQLAVDPAAVDALAVRTDMLAAAQLLAANDDQAAADLSGSALRMFRGDLLPGVGDAEWVQPHRALLEEARMKLVEIHGSARLRLGEIGGVIGELESAVAAYPFQEGLWELLITALYRAGRQADALATYQRVRTRLADELGLDPGPQLQLLEQQILLHDAELGVEVRTVDATRGNLPSLSVELIGRETEIASACELIAQSRLVEIVGPGGIGKTALAIEVGRRVPTTSTPVPGGIWLARLEAATTAEEVADVVLAALNVTGGEPALLERLRGSATLVILDNCEHVIDAAAALAERLLDAAPDVRVVCTSQLALDIDGAARLELTPLPLADAVQLFTTRARAQRKNQELTGDDQIVHDLCRSLDGLPLAIELAAARTKTLSVEDITRRLDDRFNVLRDPASRRPERRRALKATIAWSYDLLFPDDKRGLWALATFAGGASLDAVEFVLGALDVPAVAAIDVVGRLASRSLLRVDEEEGVTRYRLLDSIRTFALEELAAADCFDRAHAAHAEWFADAARLSTAGVRSERQAEFLAFARIERANIDAALAWTGVHDPRCALDIVNGFGWAWVVLGDSRGAQRLLAALAAAGEDAPAADRADALLLAAWIEASTDHLDLAREHIAIASALADTIDDVDLQARSAYYLAYVVSHEGQFRRALELTDRSDELYRGLDRSWDQAANWLFAARAAISARDEPRSVEARDRVQYWLTTVNDPWLRVRRDAMLGELARIQHRFDDAVVHIARAAEASRERGFLQTEAYQVSSLGRAQCQAGDDEAGAATLELAIQKAEATGDVRMAALARVHHGRVLRALGRDADARRALEAAATFHRSTGGGEQALLGDCLLAALDARDGIAGAGDHLRAILGEARTRADAPVAVFALDALGRIARDAGDPVAATDYAAEADRYMEAASHFITERDRTDAAPRDRAPDSPARSAR